MNKPEYLSGAAKVTGGCKMIGGVEWVCTAVNDGATWSGGGRMSLYCGEWRGYMIGGVEWVCTAVNDGATWSGG